MNSSLLPERGALAATTPVTVILLQMVTGVLFVITAWFCPGVSCQMQLKQADMVRLGHLVEDLLNIAFY